MLNKRIGLKPLSHPVTGTYWRATRPYEDDYKTRKALPFVAVIGTQRKYARLGMQTAFVQYVSAELFATNTHKSNDEHRIDHNVFYDIFEEVTDPEELSGELALAILAMYD